MLIAKELLDTPITNPKGGIYLTNQWGYAAYCASKCKSFRYYFFPQVDFTEADKEEEKELVKALKEKMPPNFKEVSDASQLEPGAYLVEVRHPSRPLVEPDMSCISFVFGKREE